MMLPPAEMAVHHSDRNSRSGAIDGRPTSEYNFADCGDISIRISSTILRIGRIRTNVTEYSFLLFLRSDELCLPKVAAKREFLKTIR